VQRGRLHGSRPPTNKLSSSPQYKDLLPRPLELTSGRCYSFVMARSIARVIFAFIVALAVAMPVSASATPMVMFGDHIAGMAGDQPCRNCSDQHQSGSTAPDKMPVCPAFACIIAPAVLPMRAQLPGPIAFRADYVRLPDARLAGADPAPDPFPPRPIVLD